MKGLIFTEFFEIIEENFGYSMVNEMIEESLVPDDRVYTSVGIYDHMELFSMVWVLSEKTQLTIDEIMIIFGKALFQSFEKTFTHYINRVNNLFDFLNSIESYIHLEVKKLYPDAEVPIFKCSKENGSIILVYESSRKMWAVALGLLQGSIKHFKVEADVTYELINKDGSKVRFEVIEKH